jgi:hypothetical protein
MTGLQPTPLPRFWPLFLIALGVRVTVVLLGLILATTPPDIRPKDDPVPIGIRDQILSGSARAIEPWYRWDAVWYANVAENGYVKARDKGGPLGVAFLPALPFCKATASALGTNPFWAGLLLANLAAAAGTALFARVAVQLTSESFLGLRVFVLLLVFPTSFFFSAPYNEAFGLLFTSLALAAWLDHRPVRAGVFAALGSLARLTGVALGFAALGEWLCENRTRTAFKSAAIFALGSFVGLFLFWCYLGWAVGDPFAGLKSQSSWGRKGLSFWNPWLAIESIYDREVPHWGEAFAAFGFAFLGIRAWVKRGAFWGILTLVPIAQMIMSGTFLSGHRLVLAALPGFIELADLLRNRLAFRVVVVVFAYIQFELLNRYIHWIFAG